MLVDVFGFIVESTFDTGDAVDGDNLIIFDVSGWHNVVHIAQGLLLR